ncbi:lysophospholipase [Thalassobaculum sp.]|uniref:alpha/beta hydrolase n=1 Tax=Thalassobaculum sp. TaxID=2022740 RepID=UPI003B59BA8F
MGSVRLSLTSLCLLVLAACAPQIARPGTEQVVPELVQRPFAVMEDGIRLPLRIWRPEGPAEAAVVALHGFGDYSNAFAQLGADLSAQGVAVYAADQRGFGEAPGYGMWHGRERMARDAETLVRLAKADLPGVPVYLLGESMGGAVAMLALSDPDTQADGAVLSAPAVWGRDWMPLVQTLSLDIMAHTVPWLPLEPRGIRIIPSDNIAMLRALARDPLFIKRPRVDTVHGLVALMGAAQAAAPGLQGAILVLYGRKDELVPRRPTCAMLRALPPRRRVALYDEGYHMLFRDLERAQVIADIAAWTRDPTAALPSGEEAGRAALERFCGG